MAGKTGKVEETTTEQLDTTTKSPNTETLPLETQTTVTPEEELETKLAQAKAEGKAEAEEVYKGIQRTLSKKDTEIQELQKKLSQPSPTGSKFKETVLADMRARATELGEPNPKIAELETELAIEKQQDNERRKDVITQGHREKFEQKIKDAGLDPDNESFDRVWDAVKIARSVDGKFEEAEARLDRVLAKVKPVKVESETEDKETKLREEIEREVLEKHGLLKTETGGPSAGGKRTFTEDQIADRDFYEANRDEILLANKEGRIKK